MYLREKQRVRVGGGVEGVRDLSRLPADRGADVGLHLRTLRSQPKLNPGAGCLTDCPTFENHILEMNLGFSVSEILLNFHPISCLE